MVNNVECTSYTTCIDWSERALNWDDTKFQLGGYHPCQPLVSPVGAGRFHVLRTSA